MLARMSSAWGELVWVDLEMTGLDPSSCVILEIATVISTGDLSRVEEGPNLTLHQPEEVLRAMPDVVQAMHKRSGLWERVVASNVTTAEAEEATLAFLRANTTKGAAPLCGNSVWKDKQFLEKYMPAMMAHLHYRIVDVSTIKELVRRWYPSDMQAPKKRESHRALDDIRESIEELSFYRRRVFVPRSGA